MIITCADGTTYDFDMGMAQGPAVLADESELAKDAEGITNPTLHKRVDPQPQPEPEIAPRQYGLAVAGVMDYRTVIKTTHDENSTTSEIP